MRSRPRPMRGGEAVLQPVAGLLIKCPVIKKLHPRARHPLTSTRHTGGGGGGRPAVYLLKSTIYLKSTLIDAPSRTKTKWAMTSMGRL